MSELIGFLIGRIRPILMAIPEEVRFVLFGLIVLVAIVLAVKFRAWSFMRNIGPIVIVLAIMVTLAMVFRES